MSASAFSRLPAILASTAIGLLALHVAFLVTSMIFYGKLCFLVAAICGGLSLLFALGAHLLTRGTNRYPQVRTCLRWWGMTVLMALFCFLLVSTVVGSCSTAR